MRKDLIDTFHTMMEHEAFAQIDWVVIETTGLADPSPVIQSLYMDQQVLVGREWAVELDKYIFNLIGCSL